MNWNRDVGDFHKMLGYPENDFPSIQQPTERASIQWRVDHMLEEIDEYQDAVSDEKLPDAIDALLDLIYLAIGTVRMHGVEIGPCWDEVHRANMKKLPGNNKKWTIKPDGWEAPDLDKVIYRDRI